MSAKQLAQSSFMNAKAGFIKSGGDCLSSILVHGFRKTSVYPQPPIYQMLALSQYPGENLVNSLARHWADIWLKYFVPKCTTINHKK